MLEEKNIIWLASYPKSGNTWFREILSFLNNEGDFDINKLDICPIYSSRGLIERETGIDTTFLSNDEADELRLTLFEKPFGEFPVFFKTHDAYTYIKGSRPIIPSHRTFCAVYLIRNPLDVAVSFSFHSNKPVSDVIKWMRDDNHSLASSSSKYNNQMRQKLLSWSGHVKSWTDQKEFPVKVIKYEDLLLHPHEIFFNTISDFLGLSYSKEKIYEAVDACSFENLKRLEEESGFREKAPGCETFFRKGIQGDYKNHMTQQQIETVINDHKDIMKHYCYI